MSNLITNCNPPDGCENCIKVEFCDMVYCNKDCENCGNINCSCHPDY